MRGVIIIVAMACCSTLLANPNDVTIVTKPAFVVVGGEGTQAQKFGDLVVIATDDTSTIEIKSAALLTINVEGGLPDTATVQIKVSDIKRIPVPFERADDLQFAITQSGTAWVDLTIIDFKSGFFYQDSIVVEVEEGGGISPDKPVDIPEPSRELQSLVQPIVAKLKADPDKAARVQAAFMGFATAIGGKSGSRITDTDRFGQINAAALQDLAMGSGVSIGQEVQAALISYVGFTAEGDGFVNRNLNGADRTKISELYNAIAWAANQ